MIPNWLSFIDLAFVLAVLLFAWGGFQKGFAGQVAYVLTFLILGILLFFAYPYIYGFLGRVFRSIDEEVIMWLLMAGLVVLSFFVFIGLTKILASLMKSQISERSDHVFGLVLGAVRGGLAALLVMIFIVMLGPQRIEENFRLKSYTGRFVVHQLVPRIRPHLSRPIITDKTREWKNKLLDQDDAGVVELN